MKKKKIDFIEYYDEINQRIRTRSLNFDDPLIEVLEAGCNEKDKEIKGRYQNLKVSLLLNHSMFDEAIKCAKQITENSKKGDEYLNAQYKIAVTYYIQSKHLQALQCVFDMKSHPTMDKNSPIYYRTLMAEAQCFLYLSNQERAIHILLEIIDASNIADVAVVYNAIVSLAFEYYKSDKYNKCEEYLIIAKNMLDKEAKKLHTNALGNFYRQNGKLLMKLKKYDEALINFDKALEADITKLNEFVSTKMQIGYLKIEMKLYDEAKKIWNELLTNEKTKSISYILIESNFGLFDIAILENELTIAYQLLEDIDKAIYNSENNIYKEQYFIKKIAVCKLLELYKEAFIYSEKLSELVQSNYKIELENRVTSFNILKELETTKQENELIKKDQELSKQKLDSSIMLLNQKNNLLKDLEDYIKNLENNNVENQKLIEGIKTKLVDCKKIIFLDANIEEKLNESQQKYIDKIRSIYKNITITEAKVAFLVSNNLSIKEIASILVKEVETIKQYRYRLRQKMNLDKDMNLDDSVKLE